MPTKSFYVKDSELDEYQVQVIQRRTNRSFIVKGCAGSGKSILALWKVKQIQEENRGTYYFIVFTKTLKQYMKDGIRTIGLKDDRILYHWQWKNQGCPSADYIVVDEAQDFDSEQIDTFKNSARVALLLYGDSAQQIYKFRNPKPLSMEQIMVQTGLPNEQLVWNHRLPKKIARFAQYLSESDDELESRCKNEGPELPKILKYSSLNAQLDAIAQIIQNRNFDDVGIFFRRNEQVESAYQYLTSKGIRVERKSKEDMDLNFTSDNVKIITLHSSKGLQFEAVFIPNCNYEDKDDRSPLYVAITRSYQSLYIMHSGDLSSFFDEIPNRLYGTTLAGPGGITL
jgi:superfamily I DNA/RNA helicase